MTDRAEGGSSLHPGQLELMLHRRLFSDDAFGVGEVTTTINIFSFLVARTISWYYTLQALNETAYGEGLVVRGRHRALLCEDTEAACEEESRREAERMLLSPVMMLATHCSRDNNRWGSAPDCNLLLWLL